mgnify:CR=1 FL=1
MPSFSYHTIASGAEGSYKEKGSKFLAFAYPVASEAEVKEKIEALKAKYFDARHHCYAWILGVDKKYYRANDDGEPNHSAGDPILGQLRAMNVTNVLIVVVRYFGGVKLGVGGLVTAYRSAAEESLKNATIVEREVCESITITYPYISTADIMRLVKEFDLRIIAQKFEESCTLEAELALRNKATFNERVNLMKMLGVQIEMV